MLCSYIFHLFSVVFAFSAIVWGAPVNARKDRIARGGADLISYTTRTETSGILNNRRGNLQPMSRTLDGANHKPAINKAARVFKKAESDLHSFAKTPRGWTGNVSIRDDIGEKLRVTFERSLEKLIKEMEKGNDVSERMVERFKEYFEMLKSFGVDLSDQLKEVSHNLPEYAKERYENLLEQLGIKPK